MATIHSMSDLDAVIQEITTLAADIDNTSGGIADAFLAFSQLIDGEFGKLDFIAFVERALRTWPAERFAAFASTLDEIQYALRPIVKKVN